MPDRTTAPPVHDISAPDIPVTQDYSVGNDLELTVLNQGEQPVLLLELIFPIGRFNESKPGIAHYVAKMLTEGTSKRTAEEIASSFDFYGSHLEVSATLDFIHLKLYALNRFFQQLVDLLSEILQEASYPASEFDKLKRIRIEQIRQQMAKNNTYAGLKFRENLFGHSHPYGLIINEELAANITIEEVRGAKDQLLVSPSIFLSGKVTEKEIEAVRSAFGSIRFVGLPAGGSQQLHPGKSEVIRREGSTQASIRIGHITINRQHQDIHKLRIANELFGGFFGSRLMKNIREEKGLTYGIHSSLVHLQKETYWSIGTEIFHEKVDLALTEISRELKQLQEVPPPEEEMKTVINYMKGKLLNSFDTPFHSLNMIKNIRLAGLPDDYLVSFVHWLEQCTPEDISEVASQYLSTENAIIVTVT